MPTPTILALTSKGIPKMKNNTTNTTHSTTPAKPSKPLSPKDSPFSTVQDIVRFLNPIDKNIAALDSEVNSAAFVLNKYLHAYESDHDIVGIGIALGMLTTKLVIIKELLENIKTDIYYLKHIAPDTNPNAPIRPTTRLPVS